MGRRKKEEDHVNHEAWAIPYGDLVTLLLAFFVVMYAMSTINEGKYRVLSDSLVAAFRSPPRSPEPIQTGELARSSSSPSVDTRRTMVALETDILRDLHQSADDMELESARNSIAALSERIEEAMLPLVDAGLIHIRKNPLWIMLEVNTETLFASGSARLAAPAREIMKSLGEILADGDVEVRVEGHTDSVPIQTEVFPSNWELSSARAASVVQLFSSQGVAPQTMAAIGYGEHRPVADNATSEGRAENRRVVITVMAGNVPRGIVDPVQIVDAGVPGKPSIDRDRARGRADESDIDTDTGGLQ